MQPARRRPITPHAGTRRARALLHSPAWLLIASLCVWMGCVPIRLRPLCGNRPAAGKAAEDKRLCGESETAAAAPDAPKR